MANPHLNFELEKEDHDLAVEVKKLMRSNNWADCFMELVIAERQRRYN